MKKTGFTLVELLLTLGIIGVTASVAVPAFMSSRPDENKMKFRKTYYRLEQAIQDALDDEETYPLSSGGLGAQNCTYSGVKPIADRIGSNNFPETSDVDTTSGRFYNTCVNCTCSFMTSDGIAWLFLHDGAIDDEQVSFDLNGAKGVNCSYNASTCPNPDTFNFRISRTGKIVAVDDKSKEYLKNPFDFRVDE